MGIEETISVNPQAGLGIGLRAELALYKRSDVEYLSTFPQLHATELELVAAGNEHRVYKGAKDALGRERYIKVPRRRNVVTKTVFGAPNAERIRTQLSLVKEFFDANLGREVVVDTQVLENKSGNYCLSVRPLRNFHHITMADLLDERIRHDVQQILDRNKVMREERGKSLGILGKKGAVVTWRKFFMGIRNGEITNLVIDESSGIPQVVIVDFGLLEVKRVKDKVSLAANQFLLRRQLGLDFKSGSSHLNGQRHLRTL